MVSRLALRLLRMSMAKFRRPGKREQIVVERSRLASAGLVRIAMLEYPAATASSDTSSNSAILPPEFFMIDSFMATWVRWKNST